jgi:hypothetical protein
VRVQFGVYLGTGLFLVAAAVVYWIFSEEGAGTVMLTLAGVLALTIAGWLGVQLRRPAPAAVAPTTDPHMAAADEWLPHASVWPLWIGAGGTVAAMGAALSRWLLVPGALVLLVGVVGWALQSRYRD